MLLKRGSNCFSGSVKISVCFPKEDFLEVSPCLAAFIQKHWTTSGEEQRLLEEPFPKPRSGSPPGIIAVMVFFQFIIFFLSTAAPRVSEHRVFLVHLGVLGWERGGVGGVEATIHTSWVRLRCMDPCLGTRLFLYGSSENICALLLSLLLFTFTTNAFLPRVTTAKLLETLLHLWVFCNGLYLGYLGSFVCCSLPQSLWVLACALQTVPGWREAVPELPGVLEERLGAFA